jgi:hypothetical protein
MSSSTEKDLLERLTKLKHPPRRPSDEIEWTQAEVRRGLDQLVTSLEEAALEAARKEGLTKADRAFLRRQKDINFASVAALRTRLAELPYADDLLFTLFEALGSTVAIVAQSILAAEKLQDFVRERQRTAPGRGKKAEKESLRWETLDRILVQARQKPENQGKKVGRSPAR